ncbi:hairy-related 3 [Synchiropus picturatus]
MEKKRRARINKCLDQLKSLLESSYSSSIRKRKLEKADILELTVKHLKNLQKNQTFSAPASELQSGFHSCLANFHHYLMMAENLNCRDRQMLTQLSGKLSGGTAREASSTMESGTEWLPADLKSPSAVVKPHTSSCHQTTRSKPAKQDRPLSVDKKIHSGREDVSGQMWRPW